MTAIQGKATAAGTLTLTAVTTASTDPVTILRVANDGDSAVTHLSFSVEAPYDIHAEVSPSDVDSLPAGVSLLARVNIDDPPPDRPATLAVTVTGTSTAGTVSAITAIPLQSSPDPIGLSIAGNTRLTESSPAELTILLSSAVYVPAKVTLEATAGGNDVRLAPWDGDLDAASPNTALEVTVPPRGTELVQVRVDAASPVRRGSAGLVVTATTAEGFQNPVTVSKTQQLDVSLAADALPSAIGVSSLVILPGLVAVWTMLSLWHADRRRLGLTPPNVAAHIWDNKAWLFAALGISLAAGVVYASVGNVDLLDTYRLTDIFFITAGTAAISAVAAWLALKVYRWRLPLIAEGSGRLETLRAAAKSSNQIERDVYQADGREGLLVHKDGTATVLMPPVEYTELDTIGDTLDQALRILEAAGDRGDRVRFGAGTRWVPVPTAVVDGAPTGRRERVLVYRDNF